MTASRAPDEASAPLEDLIQWRRLQLQALHVLRLRLRAIEDGLDGGAAGYDCFSFQPPSTTDEAHQVLQVRIPGGTVELDTGFLGRDRLTLARLLQDGPAGAASADAAAPGQRVAARIDELNQLNRCSFEVLRIVASFRGSRE